MLCLSEVDVERLLDPDALIAGIEQAFLDLAEGEVVNPPELRIDDFERPANYIAFPAYLPRQDIYAVKVLAAVEGNRAQGLPFIHALVVVMSAVDGRPRALVEAGYLTACRTAAASAVATRHLASPARRCFGMIGTGIQGRAHVEVLPRIGGFERVLVHSPSGAHERARALATRVTERSGIEACACDDVADLLREADVVTVATLAQAPVFDAALLRADAHLNVVGRFHPRVQQVPTALLERAGAIVSDCVDRFRAYWQPTVGDAVAAADLERVQDLAELVRARRAGQRAPRPAGPTLFFAGGMAIEDAVAALLVDAAARAEAEMPA